MWLRLCLTLLSACVLPLTSCCPKPRCPPCAHARAASQEDGPRRAAAARPGPTRRAVPRPVAADMVRVKAGAFLRGSPAGKGLKDERPQRWIHLGTYDLDKNETTVAQYDQCVRARKCTPASCMKATYKLEKRPKHPVVCVTWYQARDYCQFRGKRLPTEAEWEKAARGDKGFEYPWGNAKPTCKLANYAGCQKPDSALRVGSLPKGASPYGALDMSGNVHEWVSDWHSGTSYATGPKKNPTGPAKGTDKVVRGGSFVYGTDELDTHGRTFIEPVKNTADVGIRCASSVPD